MDIATVTKNAKQIATEWKAQVFERQQRTELQESDYNQLMSINVPLLGVPKEFGGLWTNLQSSGSSICKIIRILASGDPSVALSSTMHQGVLSPWRVGDVPDEYLEQWNTQKSEVFQTVLDGNWWGTIVSEPGSGGDSGLTKTATKLDSGLKYFMTGKKHFGSGSGRTSFMSTRAVPEGEETPDIFFINVKNLPWDGSKGVKLDNPWKGRGMRSTNSHAFTFTNFPATRIAWPGHATELMASNGGLGPVAFTSVITGVVDTAMEHCKSNLEKILVNTPKLKAFQEVEWTKAEQEYWLINQALENTLLSIDNGTSNRNNSLMLKETVAVLADSILNRLCKLTGGTAYTWYSPLGGWLEDVRALGFLRPPWALAYEQLFNMSMSN
ncbi:MAG TPA: hypothetical protein DEZ08_04365 [Dehalococcoidia bacterium]|jgi:alkylation response protein AidB-like acyl-CoA dehydrogenase|nr:hypothetical protein [Dehalococcoidia bacterium]